MMINAAHPLSTLPPLIRDHLRANDIPITSEQRKFIHVVIAREKEIISSIELQRHVQDIGEALEAHIFALAEYRSLLAPIRRLPIELLSIVMEICCNKEPFRAEEYAIDYFIPLHLSQVCFFWRNVITTYSPRIWQTITLGISNSSGSVPRQPNFRLLERILGWSKNLPLRLTINYASQKRPSAESLLKLTQQSHRWESINLIDLNSQGLELISRARGRFQSLKTLELKDGIYNGCRSNTFQDAPLLSKVRYHLLAAGEPGPLHFILPWSQLQSLEFSRCEFSMCLNVLKECLNVSQLCIDYCYRNGGERETSESTTGSLVLPYLKEVTFKAGDIGDLEPICDHLSLPSLEHLSLYPGSVSDSEGSLNFLHSLLSRTTSGRLKHLHLLMQWTKCDSRKISSFLLSMPPAERQDLDLDRSANCAIVLERLILKAGEKPMLPHLAKLSVRYVGVPQEANAIEGELLSRVIRSRWLGSGIVDGSGFQVAVHIIQKKWVEERIEALRVLWEEGFPIDVYEHKISEVKRQSLSHRHLIGKTPLYVDTNGRIW